MDLGGVQPVVGDEQRRGALLPGEPQDQVDDRGAPLRVEGARRLVHEQDPRAVHEGSGDVHALLLATRQLCRPPLRLIGQPDRVEELVRASCHLGA
ncbi:MAG: hypothetical protein R3C32_07995 [Chloroflexota bacterium]